MEEIEQLETLDLGGGGNTKAPPTQPPQHIHHTFTYNNYENSAIEMLINLFSHIAYDFVFQEEKGESGTPHLQGVV
uniref:hypothetical protein n=1 Tax=Yoonia sp. TaxID=2212373 RepID=UPI00404828F7